MSMLLESEPLSPYAESLDALALDQQPTVFDRFKTVFHNAVEYVGDTLSTPARQLTAGLALAGSALATMGAVAPVTAEANTKGTVIEINQGIGAVHLGQTLNQVQSEVGKPTQKSPDAKTWFYDSSAPFAELGYTSNKRINYITPNSTKDKTSKGIGEGSSVTALKTAYPNAKCAPQLGVGNATVLGCDIKGRLKNGKSVDTNFMFSTSDGSGGISTITISAL